tara:strand:- start:1739 stop:3205 length:1467 start_codon:yes stop_codon:yes gene_type:complete
MGTYSQPGKVIDKSLSVASASGAAMINKGVEYQKERNKEKKIIKENKLKRDNAISQQMSGISESVYKLKGPTVDATTKIQELYSNELDRISNIGKNAIGGDMSEYWNEIGKFKASVASVPTFLGVVNNDASSYEKSLTIQQDQPGAILNNTGPGVQSLYTDISENAGSNLNWSLHNGQLIVDSKYMETSKDASGVDVTGEKTFTLNSAEYLTEFDKGKNIINFVKDKSKVLKSVFDSYSSDYKPIAKSILEEVKGGKTGTSIKTTKEDWLEANYAMENKLAKSDQVRGAIDQSMWQQLKMDEDGDGEIDPFENTEEQIDAAAEKLAGNLMGQYGSTDKIKAIYEDNIKDVTSTVGDDGKIDKNKLNNSNFNSWANNILGDGAKSAKQKSEDFIANIVVNIDPGKSGVYRTGAEIASGYYDKDGDPIAVPSRVSENPAAVFMVSKTGVVQEMIFNFANGNITNEQLTNHFHALKKSIPTTGGGWGSYNP